MEEKIFDLITKMYTEFVDFRTEMLAFKDDMLAFKDDMLAFKDDMLAFKDDMLAFKDDMLTFKDDMLAFKDDMLAFKDDTTSFREDITARLNQNTADIAKLSSQVECNTIKLENIDNHVITLENTLSEKTSALFDGYKLLDSKFDRQETKLDSISSVVEKQAVEIRVIQGGRK